MFEDAGFVEACMLRIFVAENARHGLGPLYDAIVRKARQRGVNGATVFRGVEGFGNHREIHPNRVFSFGSRMPVVIEIVDSEDKINALLPEVDVMIREGVRTIERVFYRRYRSAERRH
jgi:PII-like signaling protein